MSCLPPDGSRFAKSSGAPAPLPSETKCLKSRPATLFNGLVKSSDGHYSTQQIRQIGRRFDTIVLTCLEVRGKTNTFTDLPNVDIRVSVIKVIR